MGAASEVDLPLTERVVLGLVAEGPTHGWALAQLLAPTGPVGTVWTVRRALVYRAVSQLTALGFIDEVGLAPSARGGPQRMIIRVTLRGRRLAASWLEQPVAHVRDMRTEFLVKLLLLHRKDGDVGALVRRQRASLMVIAQQLSEQLSAATDFDAVLLRWRVESSDAALRFLDSVVPTADAYLGAGRNS